MDYFVSIENITYHRWQIELLIESFRMMGIEDQLVIGVVKNETPQFGGFSGRLVEHKRKFSQEDYGGERGCKALNKPYGLLAALSNNILKQPFAVLHPDMILCKEIEDPKENFLFSAEKEDKDLKERIQPYIKEILASRGEGKDLPWLGVSGLCVFKEVPLPFFSRVLVHTERILKEHPDWDDAPKAGWTLALYEFYSLALYQGKYMECGLLNNIEDVPDCHVVHYNKGIPPYFTKKQFMFSDPVNLTMGGYDPMDILRRYDQSTAMKLVQQMAIACKQGEAPYPDELDQTVPKAVGNPPTPLQKPQQVEVTEGIIEPRMPIEEIEAEEPVVELTDLGTIETTEMIEPQKS